VLPPKLAALTALVLASMPPYEATAPLPPLTQLAAICRLDLRFSLPGPHAGCAMLPELPTGLTHLTLSVRQLDEQKGDVEPLPHQQVTDALSYTMDVVHGLPQPSLLAFSNGTYTHRWSALSFTNVQHDNSCGPDLSLYAAQVSKQEQKTTCDPCLIAGTCAHAGTADAPHQPAGADRTHGTAAAEG